MKKALFLIIFCTVIGLSACSVPHDPPTPTPTAEPLPTETPIPEPTPTIPPSAAVVNGLYVAIEDLETKKEQLRDAYNGAGEALPADDQLREEALNDLIEETLFLHAAQKNGIAPSAAELDARTQALCEKMGGCDALRNWQSQNHFSEDGFRRALEREAAAASMRDKILASLEQTEQYHIYRIWSDRKSDLDDVVSKLGLGISFTELAKNYDAVTGGDMSWFPRGILFSGDLEDKIFSLNPGEHTEILEIDGVYNIFYIAEKQSGRSMDTQVRQLAERKALGDWLEEQRKQAVIEIL